MKNFGFISLLATAPLFGIEDVDIENDLDYYVEQKSVIEDSSSSKKTPRDDSVNK